MPASSHNLASALAARLAGILPSPLTVVAKGFVVCLFAGDTLIDNSASAHIVDLDDGRTIALKVEVCAEAVLSEIQDSVAKYLHEPWPKLGRREMALPGARADDTFVHLWYGEEGSTAHMPLAPIALSDI